MTDKNITHLYNITPEELREMLRENVRNELKEVSKSLTPEPVVEYLTRKEVAKKLKVALSTISEWDKIGVLKPYRLGNLVRYKSTEIDLALKKIEK